MGTSSSNSGQLGSTPLIPSWLDDDFEEGNEIPGKEDGERFRTPRSNFTRFLSSNGTDREALRRAASSYVSKSMGGTENATKRLGSAVSSSRSLAGVLNSFSSRGVQSTLKDYGLQHLAGLDSKEILAELIDVICPDGGTIDEGIVRDAYIETVTYFLDVDIDLENMGEDIFQDFMETFFANVIKGRLINDIGLNLIKVSSNYEELKRLQRQVFTFIKGAITDAVAKIQAQDNNAPIRTVVEKAQNIYNAAFGILESEE